MPTTIAKFFGFLVFALAWLGYDHYRPWVNFHSEALAFAGIGFLAISICLHRATTSAPQFVYIIFAVAFVPWIQYVVGIVSFAGDALLVSLYIFGLCVAIWIGFNAVLNIADDSKSTKTENLLPSIFQIIWIVALVSATVGLLQWLSLQEPLGMYVVQTDPGDRARGNLGQPNQLATLLLMGIASLAYSFECKRIGTIGLKFGVLFITVTLVLTQSRAAMVSAAVMTVFLIYKNKKVKSRIKPSHIFYWLLIFAIGVFALPYLSDLLLMSGPRGLKGGTDSERMLIWKQVYSAIIQAPFFGYGWNQTTLAQTFGSLVVPGDVTYTNAHNFFLDIISWNGIPLGLLIISLCVFWLLSRLYFIKHINSTYAACCLLPLSVHSMFEYPYAYAYFLLTAGLMIGVVEASHPKYKSIKLQTQCIALSISFCFFISSYLVYEYLLVEEDFRVVRFENLRIGQTPIDYEVPNILILSQMASMLEAGRQQALPNMPIRDLENLRSASLRFPYGPLSLRYALALGLNGNPAGASRQMAIIKGMYGERYYQAAVSVLRQLESEKYPELSMVVTH